MPSLTIRKDDLQRRGYFSTHSTQENLSAYAAFFLLDGKGDIILVFDGLRRMALTWGSPSTMRGKWLAGGEPTVCGREGVTSRSSMLNRDQGEVKKFRQRIKRFMGPFIALNR